LIYQCDFNIACPVDDMEISHDMACTKNEAVQSSARCFTAFGRLPMQIL
jgi:hypothetical protein